MTIECSRWGYRYTGGSVLLSVTVLVTLIQHW